MRSHVHQLLMIVHYVKGRVLPSTFRVLTQSGDEASYDATLALAGGHCVDLQIASFLQPIGGAHSHTSLIVIQLVLQRSHHSPGQTGSQFELLVAEPLEVHFL